MCKLHNEVFVASKIRLNTKYSLTTREGISTIYDAGNVAANFPHGRAELDADGFIRTE